MFKRASIRYSDTPEPSTPYQAAGQLWDERMGSARAQAMRWRWMAFCCIGVSVTLAGGLVWQSARSRITPYVIEVDSRGEVKSIGALSEVYRPTDAQLAHHLERFIRDVRSVPLDPIVLRENWLEAYDFATPRGAAFLNDYARANDPFKNVGRSSISVEVVSVVRVSPTSFQARWIEHRFANATPTATEHWTAIVSFLLKPPGDELQLRKNPLGLYVDGVSWTRELGSTEH